MRKKVSLEKGRSRVVRATLLVSGSRENLWQEEPLEVGGKVW